MSENTKTTVYLDADDYQRLKQIARAQGKSTAQVVREAVAVYAVSAQASARPTSVGAGRSGRGDVSERAEDLLAGFGRKPAK